MTASLLLYFNYANFGNPLLYTEQLHTQQNPSQNSILNKIKNPLQPIIFNLISPYRGIFFLSPILLFSFIGMAKLYKMNRLNAILFSALFLIPLVIYSSWADWDGGLAYGQRFLLLGTPYLVISISLSIDDIKSKTNMVRIFIALFFISVIINGTGALTSAYSWYTSIDKSQFVEINFPALLKGQLSGWPIVKYVSSTSERYLFAIIIFLSIFATFLYLFSRKKSTANKEAKRTMLKGKINIDKISILLFLISCIIFAYFITGFHSANESSALALTKAIVEDKSLSINNFKDLASVDISEYNGSYYSDKPPGRALFGIPIYIVDKILGFTSDNQIAFSMELLTVLFSSLSVVVMYKLSLFLKISRPNAVILSFILGFATILWSFSKTFFAHPYSAFFNLLSLFMLLLALEKNQKKYLVFSGVSMGLSLLMEYPNFLVVIILGAYYLYRNRFKNIPNILILAISFTAVASIMLLYNYSIFGNPFITTDSYQVSYGNVLQTQLFKVAELKNGLYGLLVGSSGGLFYFSPVLLLSILGMLYWIKDDIRNKKNRDRFLGLALLLSFSAVLIFYAAKEGWRGGNSFGPRYLLPVIPFLVIPIGKVMQKFNNSKLFWAIFAILLVYSLFINSLGSLVDPTPSESFNDPVYQHNFPILLSGHLDSFLYGQAKFTLYLMIFTEIILLFLLFRTLRHGNLHKT